MAKRLQLRRGTATEHSSFTGAIGELTYDTTNKKLKIHDGSTVGGLDVGSSISINRSITSGTKIADITIDGNTSSLYFTPTDISTSITKSGNRGSLAGYETVGSERTINATCADCNEVSSDITVSDGTSGTAWTKIVRVTAPVTVTLGSNWKWAGNEAPTITAGGIFLFCWCGSAGIANFMPNS